jgi:hypothetical protein
MMDGFVGTLFLTLLMLPIARLILKRCTPPYPAFSQPRAPVLTQLFC